MNAHHKRLRGAFTFGLVGLSLLITAPLAAQHRRGTTSEVLGRADTSAWQGHARLTVTRAYPSDVAVSLAARVGPKLERAVATCAVAEPKLRQAAGRPITLRYKVDLKRGVRHIEPRLVKDRKAPRSLIRCVTAHIKAAEIVHPSRPETARQAELSVALWAIPRASVEANRGLGQKQRRKVARVNLETIEVVSGPLVVDEVRKLTRRHARAFTYCYERELVKNPFLSGSVVLRLDVAGDGRVRQAEVLQTTIRDGGDVVATCVARQSARLRFTSTAKASEIKLRAVFTSIHR